MSSHFTISPFGSAGDVYPLLGLALRLRDRGHDVSFAANGYFAETVGRHGLDFIELGSAEEYAKLLNSPDLWNQLRSFGHMFNSTSGLYFRQHYELLDRLNRQRRTIAISNGAFGARIAQERLGIPLVSVHVQPALLRSRISPPQMTGNKPLPRWIANAVGTLGVRLVVDRVALPELNRFRTALGLKPIRSVVDWWSSPERNVCLFPDWFAPKQPDWPPNTDLTDFPLWDDQADEPLPPDVQSFLDAGARPVVFTPGSANVYGAGFFRTAVEACLAAGRRGILLSRFPHHVPANLPPGIRRYAYVPLGKLLPRTAAIVHHGGIGTTAQALAAGVPQLIVALAHDQFDNASRVARLGVGGAIGRHQFRARSVARRIGALLESADVRASCERVAGRFAARNGLDVAADRIEDFAAEVRGRHDVRWSESVP